MLGPPGPPKPYDGLYGWAGPFNMVDGPARLNTSTLNVPADRITR